MKRFIVYILRTSANTLYTGQTNDIKKRLREHREKKVGAKYMRGFDNFDLVYVEKFATRTEAMKREIEIKSWPKRKKEELILERNKWYHNKSS